MGSYLRFFIILVCIILSFPNIVRAEEERTDLNPWEYKLGEGLRLADTDFRIGGYASFKYTDAGGSRGRFVFDDLSLFVFGEISQRIDFLSEWEATRYFEIDTEGNTTTNRKGELERFYFDYLSSDTLKIRGGKFLTPIGTWNEIHADPLTWTVSRPIVTFAAFPQYTTGIKLFGALSAFDQDLEYSIFLQNNEGINESTGFRKTHLLYGGRLKWDISSKMEIGIPLLYYLEYVVDDKVYLTGIDIVYKRMELEVRGETTYSRIDIKDGRWTEEYGYYLQGVYGFTERHFLVLRHEYFKGRADGGIHNAFSIGGIYKIKPQIVFKIEYQIRGGSLELQDANDSERFLASFAILF